MNLVVESKLCIQVRRASFDVVLIQARSASECIYLPLACLKPAGS